MTIPNDENKIRNALLEEFLNQDDMRKQNDMKSFLFFPESLENYDYDSKTYLGRADIKVLLKSNFSQNEKYYIIECKRLDGNIRLNRKFVEEGVDRFITGKYSSYYKQSSLLGFVVVTGNDLAKLYDNIVDVQNSRGYHSDEIDSSDAITLTLNKKRRFAHRDLTLDYILFDFSEIISLTS